APEPRAAVLPTKDPQLMAQDEDLKVLRAVARGSAGEGSGEGTDHQAEEEPHPRILGTRWVLARIWVFDPDRTRRGGSTGPRTSDRSRPRTRSSHTFT